MKARFYYWISFLIAVFWFSEPLFAQINGGPAVFSRMGMGARTMGVSNAGSASVADGAFGLLNPASISLQPGFQAEIGSAALSFDRNWNTAHILVPLPPSAVVQLGVVHGGVRNIDARTPSGYPDGTLSTNEYLVFGTFGIQSSKKFTLGATLKWYYSNLHADVAAASTAGIDFGFLYRFDIPLRFGISVHDLVSKFTWNTADLYDTALSQPRNETFPRRTKASLAYTYLPESEWMLELEHRSVTSELFSSIAPNEFQNGFSIGTLPTTQSGAFLRSGVRHKLHERIVLRAGFETTDAKLSGETLRVSSGFSLLLPYDSMSPTIDYAFVRDPNGVSFMHVFSVRFSWKGSK